MKYLVWIEVRKLKTHPFLLVPGWTGFNIIVRNGIVVESVISYLDTIDSPATDLKTAYEVLCRGCEIRERLNLCAVACVFDQAFYAKAMEIYWKHKDMFKNLIIMLGGFHLLMMLFGVIGARFGDAGLCEVAIQSDLFAGRSIDSVLNKKNYNRAAKLCKTGERYKEKEDQKKDWPVWQVFCGGNNEPNVVTILTQDVTKQRLAKPHLPRYYTIGSLQTEELARSFCFRCNSDKKTSFSDESEDGDQVCLIIFMISCGKVTKPKKVALHQESEQLVNIIFIEYENDEP
ncbi:Hypothetical predicted protein, partial [Paramuricea clavata]